MAKFGLQNEYIDKILSIYFGLINIEEEEKEIFVGLGYSQQGAVINTDKFSEVSGKSYKRAKIYFDNAKNGKIYNKSDVIFPVATEDWTSNDQKISMIGIFNDNLSNSKPLVVLELPREEIISSGETVSFKKGSVVLTFGNK